MPTSFKSKFIKVSPRLLLSFYFCLPAACLLVLADWLLFEDYFKNLFSVDPNDYALFTLLFTLPHILSSFFGFLDKEYIQTYKSKLIKGARYVVFAAILLPLISLDLAFFVFAIFTMYHVFRQQSGISKSLMRGSNVYHNYWEWFGVLLSLGLYIVVYTEFTPSLPLIWAWILGCVAYTVLGVYASKASKTKIGKQYFWATHVIPFASATFLFLEYPVLSIAVPRIIHDLTGYAFYITHDFNRFADAGSNYLYRIFSKLKLSVIVVNPMVSISLALLFQVDIFGGLYMTLTVLFLFHYYTESFIWKSGSFHRRYIEYSS